MTISIGQAVLIAAWYTFTASCFTFNMGFVGWSKPIFGGWLVGLILGDALTGLKMGASIQLLYIANVSAGGASSADANLAGVVGTALAMASGGSYTDAILFAIPLGLVGNIRTMLNMTLNAFWTHLFDPQAEKGNYRGMLLWQVVVPQIIQAFSAFLMVFGAVTLGSQAMADMFQNFPAPLTRALNTIAGALPAAGICMALNMIFKKNTAPFFFLGFVLYNYLGFSGIILACIGALMAYIATFGVKPAGGEK